ncbi:Periplasmic serine endoprotease DegP precursor [Aquisphaera giovannonii]|uniref:Periplasmic serine endoprotease DegP n=1 Tax=Aquisphaera giovannonii TaxID=406548 RepID=A0A5B9WEY0_9BACT|nr:trypsin-like peptidase domain-containing protein [Aquisphaera giovannonii]QEH39023.1 Periplasmic serine endoprotease DegP precursor [Aquisphaera giovannonii]
MPPFDPSSTTRTAARIAAGGLLLAAMLGLVYSRGTRPWSSWPVLPGAADAAGRADSTGSRLPWPIGTAPGDASDAKPAGQAEPEDSPARSPSVAGKAAGRPGDGRRKGARERRADAEAAAGAEAAGLVDGREGKDGRADDSAALFATMERLERLIAAGMARARESVVSLEYTSEGSRDSRRMACGVVINASGDLLSVRIDRPGAGPGGAAPAAAPASPPPPTAPEPIVARDVTGRRHLAHWVADDPESGLTLLQIPARSVPPIEIAPADPVLGGQVFVIGNAFGLGHTVSRGYIAGLDRALRLGARQLGGLIQVQAKLYPGDSGAAVTNQRGQLLGLIRSGLAPPAEDGNRPARDRPRDRDRDRDNDFGFAIAARDLLWVADQLRAHGHVDRAYLGVRLEHAPGAGAAPADPLAEGAALQEVLEGTPAALAGLRAGDLIVAIDGQPVRSPADVNDRLDRLPSQALVRLEVVRGRGEERRLIAMEMRTSSRPDAGPRQAAGPPPASPSRPPEAENPGSPPTPVTHSAPSASNREDRAAGPPPIDVVPTSATPATNPPPAPDAKAAAKPPADGPTAAPPPVTGPDAPAPAAPVVAERLERAHLERKATAPRSATPPPRP